MILPTSERGWLVLVLGEVLRLDPEINSEKIFEKPGDWQADCVFGFWMRIRHSNDYLPMHDIPTKLRLPLKPMCTFPSLVALVLIIVSVVEQFRTRRCQKKPPLNNLN